MPLSRPTSSPAAYATNGGVRTEPDAGEKATGIIAAQRIPAKIMNWLWGVALEWVAWFAAIIDSNEEHTYQTAKDRTYYIPVRLKDAGAGWVYDGLAIKTATHFDAGAIDITEELRTGQVLKSMKVEVWAGHTDATSTNLMELRVYRVAVTNPTSGNGTLISGAVFIPNSAAAQLVDLGTINETIDRTQYLYWLRVDASATAGDGGTPDRVLALQLTVSDEGPRNPS